MGKSIKKFVGAHVSIAGGVENAPINAAKIGANAFAMFTKNQRQWTSKPLSDQNISQFKKNLKETKIRPEHVLTHDGYLINLGNANKEKRKKSYEAFLDEVQRVELLGLELLNFHPGSHLKEISEEESLKLVANSMNEVIDRTKKAILVIENTAGQGTNLGYSFEHLAMLIEQIEEKKRVGVCLDTCHMFSAGYDISTKAGFLKVMKEFDKMVGFKFLKGMHLNDSKVELGKRVDRHEGLGEGTIGMDTFKYILSDPRFDNIPLILETPDDSKWAKEIKTLMSFV